MNYIYLISISDLEMFHLAISCTLSIFIVFKISYSLGSGKADKNVQQSPGKQ
jgi:hypothetical protein